MAQELEERLKRLEQALLLGGGGTDELESRLARIESVVNRLVADPTIGAALVGYPSFGGRIGKLTEQGVEFKDEAFNDQRGLVKADLDYDHSYLYLLAETMRQWQSTQLWDEFAQVIAKSSDSGEDTATVILVEISTAGSAGAPGSTVTFTFRRSGYLAIESGGLAIKDGVTAPDTLTDYALIYVDTSDGDLKVKFGDGTVKTLATDT